MQNFWALGALSPDPQNSLPIANFWQRAWSATGPVATVLLAVHEQYCSLWPGSQQIICPTKCQHFGEISRKTVYAICKFTASHRTVVIVFLLKRYCSKSVSLIHFGLLYQTTLIVEFWFRKTRTTYDKTRAYITRWEFASKPSERPTHS